MARVVIARAPVRNADLGGWRDTRLFSSGKVLNMGIRLYTYVSLVRTKRKGIRIESHDIGDSEYVRSVRKMEYKGTLGLLKAAIGSSGARGGLRMIVRSEAPPASGLGSSAALAVAALGALYRYQRRNVLTHHVAADAHRLETDFLGLECGVQDQLAAAFGSSATHTKVIANFERGDRKVLRAFDGLETTAELGMEALMRDDLKAYAEALNLNWRYQKHLHKSITTPQVDRLEQRARKLGCIGFKLNGAGSGGTAVMICARNTQKPIISMIHKNFPEMVVYPAKVDIGRCQGLQVWEAKE